MLAKQIIERPRPPIPESGFLISADSEFAFPSGIALMVAGGSVIIIAFFLEFLQGFDNIYLVDNGGRFSLFFTRICRWSLSFRCIGGIFLGVGVAFLFVWKQNDLELLCHLRDKSTRQSTKRQ